MKILRDPVAVPLLNDRALQHLVEVCFSRLTAIPPYDPDVMGWVAIAEPGDLLEELEQATGCPIHRGWGQDSSFGCSEFSPAWEYLDEYETCYEMVFVLEDSGYGVALYVPKVPGIDPRLQQLCMDYATPASCETSPNLP